MSASRTSGTTPGGAPKRGSAFSDKQIAFAVKDGKPVRVYFDDCLQIQGWICGIDDYHWGVVDASGEVNLVHKSVGRLTILSEPMGIPPEVEAIVAPCRDYVMREFFKTPAPANP